MRTGLLITAAVVLGAAVIGTVTFIVREVSQLKLQPSGGTEAGRQLSAAPAAKPLPAPAEPRPNMIVSRPAPQQAPSPESPVSSPAPQPPPPAVGQDPTFSKQAADPFSDPAEARLALLERAQSIAQNAFTQVLDTQDGDDVETGRKIFGNLEKACEPILHYVLSLVETGQGKAHQYIFRDVATTLTSPNDRVKLTPYLAICSRYFQKKRWFGMAIATEIAAQENTRQEKQITPMESREWLGIRAVHYCATLLKRPPDQQAQWSALQRFYVGLTSEAEGSIHIASLFGSLRNRPVDPVITETIAAFTALPRICRRV